MKLYNTFQHIKGISKFDERTILNSDSNYWDKFLKNPITIKNTDMTNEALTNVFSLSFLFIVSKGIKFIIYFELMPNSSSACFDPLMTPSKKEW